MSRIVIVLFALIAISLAHHDENREHDNRSHEERDYQKRLREEEEHHGTPKRINRRGPPRHPSRIPQQYMTKEVFDAVHQCKEKLHFSFKEHSESEFDCLVACVMEKIGEINESGKLNVDKIVQDIYTKAQLEEKMARSCVAEVHADESTASCDVAGAYFKCIMKKTFDIRNHP